MPYSSQIVQPTPLSYDPWVDSRVARLSTAISTFHEDGPSGTSSEYSYTAQDSGLTNNKMDRPCYYDHTEDGTSRTSVDRRSMDSAYHTSHQSSPWPSSDNISDTCSGTWSSPAASGSYSPEPHPAIYTGPYDDFQCDPVTRALRPYPPLGAVRYPDHAPGFFTPAIPCQPYYQQPWDYTPQQVPVAFIPEEATWNMANYSHTSFDQDSEPSPSPHPVPEVKSMPKRRGRKPNSHPRIKKEEPSSPVNIQPLERIQEMPQASTHMFSTKSSSTKSFSFPCPLAIYGCTSSFVSKNEWKRHINTQHLCLETWRCDQCAPQRNGRTNDFNRKDLFIQHLRRMHFHNVTEPDSKKPISPKTKHPQHNKSKTETSEKALWKAENRCHVKIRAPPTRCACLFCDASFAGREAWAARTEHLAKHLEEFKKVGRSAPDFEMWNEDHELEEWLLREKVLIAKGRRLQLKSQTRV